MDIRKKIGNHIKELRQGQDMTQGTLSFRAEIDKTYLSEVENGKRNVSVVNLEKIILALGISIKDFFDNEIFKSKRK